MVDMAIELVPLGTMTVETGSVTSIAGGPISRRVVVELRNIRIEGERLRGLQHGATAGDWLVVGPDDTATLDIRFCIKTHDGALIYVHAAGRADAKTFGSGGATYLAPVFETADERYAWLNSVQAIAKGHGTATEATFELFEAR
jgi:hypothetical protein